MTKTTLLSLVLLLSLGARAAAVPIVTLGPPVSDGFVSIDPGSIRVEGLGAGELVDLQLSLTIDPFCIRPINIELGTTGDDGTFTDRTGVVTNGCGGDTSLFDIRLTGDGLAHAFEIEFVDADVGFPLAAIPVELFPRMSDTDSDEISDLDDNCTEVANPDQRDTDGDNIGNACDADIASPNDCSVNFDDLGTLAEAFFSAPGALQWNPDADFNGDDIVNFIDLNTMANQFFGVPGPSARGCN